MKWKICIAAAARVLDCLEHRPIGRLDVKATLLVFACVLSLLVAEPASSQVIPAGLDTVAGNSNSAILAGLNRPTRVQQVYSGAEVGSGTILGLRFRQDEVAGTATGSCTWVGATVIVSSTTIGPDFLTNDFASNHGVDATMVYQGDLGIAASDNTSDPRPFEILIPFTTGFAFDSSGGLNLLVDITAPNQELSAPCGGLPRLDTQLAPSDSVSTVYCWNGSCSPTFDASTAFDTSGMVTLILKQSIFADGFESSDTSASTEYRQH